MCTGRGNFGVTICGNSDVVLSNQQGTTIVREHSRKSESPQFLSGWKEIASYLAKGVRTVQRYERQMGLPIRRPAGASSGSVLAVKAELDGWVQASPIRRLFHLKRTAPVNTAELRQSISELARLRGQMLLLRSEMNESLQKLQESVRFLLEHRQSASQPPTLMMTENSSSAGDSKLRKVV
jgi:hypothetical protein